MTDQQGIEAQKGEIAFRRMMSRQETENKIYDPDVFSAEEIIAFLKQGLEETRRVFTGLHARGVKTTPFLELGAERGHRSACLVNEFAAQGTAFDLSLDALSYGAHLQAEFRYKDLPMRVCGDVYNLPFRSDVFPFVFCFATLHHLPDPAVIVKEAVRVLQNDGYFYFDREPTRGMLAVTLWTRRGHKLSPFEKILNRLGILGFISEGGGVEREYGILENTFALDTWTNLKGFFTRLEMQVNRTLKIRFDATSTSFTHRFAQWVGGVTSGLGHVSKPTPPVTATEWVDMLRCPTCRKDSSGLHWRTQGQTLECDVCKTRYPQQNGVFVLLDAQQQQTLYPDLRKD